MKLIADSGSTKTAWCLVSDDGRQERISTQGINPYHQTEADIVSALRTELLPALCEGRLPQAAAQLDVFFYGAGCTPEASPRVASALQQVFGAGTQAHVESDMLGAARALCRHDAGIVAILGTGSNSCLYDGKRIVANVSPLGYILGDEGSGAYIGKRLVGDVLKRQLPDDVCRLFLEETQLTAADIVRRTYSEPLPNRFLASLSPFCARHRSEPAVHRLLLDCFRQFFRRNISAYSASQVGMQGPLKVHFVGSVAYHYRDEIRTVASDMGYAVGNVLSAPIEGLIDYHT